MFTGKNKKEQTSETPETAAAPGGLPLFFSKPAVVHPERHGQAGIKRSQDTSFARATNSIPLTVAEFSEAAKYYPIAFTGEEIPTPIVLVGLEQENYFVDAKGEWNPDAYIPAYVRKYPFVFMQNPGSDQLTLCVDENAAQFSMKTKNKDYTPLFTDNQPSEFTRNALTFCAAIQEQHAITRAFCEVLKSLDLFSPQRSDVKLVTGRTISLGGFQLIDQEKLAKLPDEKILELHKQGWLPLIYYTFLATSNWQKLVNMAALRERKN